MRITGLASTDRTNQAVAQRCQLWVGRLGLPGRFLAQLWQGCGVAGLFDLGDQGLRVIAGGDRDDRLFGRVVDRRVDPVQAVQVFLDAHRAGGAGHPGDLQLDAVHRGR